MATVNKDCLSCLPPKEIEFQLPMPGYSAVVSYLSSWFSELMLVSFRVQYMMIQRRAELHNPMMEQEEETDDMDLSLGVGLTRQTRKYFHHTSQTFESSSGTGSDLFEKFVKESEQRFQLHSHSFFSGFNQNGPDFVRSISAGSGWTTLPSQMEGNSLFPFSQTSHPSRLTILDNTLSADQFPTFFVSNRQMWTTSSNEKVTVSHSSYEYRTNMSSR
jgi:hypothetical protein